MYQNFPHLNFTFQYLFLSSTFVLDMARFICSPLSSVLNDRLLISGVSAIFMVPRASRNSPVWLKRCRYIQ